MKKGAADMLKKSGSLKIARDARDSMAKIIKFVADNKILYPSGNDVVNAAYEAKLKLENLIKLMEQ